MKTIDKIMKVTLAVLFALSLIQCTEEQENECYERPNVKVSEDPNDVYLQAHIFEPYGTAVRWRWDNRFIKPEERATPIKAEYVIPVTKVLQYFWIELYASQGEAGKKVIKDLFPSELQYIGSSMYEGNGREKLGFAESGTRITITRLNDYDLFDLDWLTGTGAGILSTVHHEFGHIIHMNYGLPEGFKEISSYTGNGWDNITEEEALQKGGVSKYATNGENDAFAETLAHFLLMPKEQFEDKYITLEDCSASDNVEVCQKNNAGRKMIAQKVALIKKLFKEKLHLDLDKMRDEMQTRLEYVVDNGEIPIK